MIKAIGYATQNETSPMKLLEFERHEPRSHDVQNLRPLTERIQRGEIDPSFLITHRIPLEQAPHGYEIFKHKQDNCIKIVLKPGAANL